MVNIVVASNQSELDEVRNLPGGFLRWHLERNHEYRDLLDRYFKARKAGYMTLFLDTSISQVEAIRLNHSPGFEDIEPYCDVPDDLRDWRVFMSMDLQAD